LFFVCFFFCFFTLGKPLKFDNSFFI
jgi:hypothetical protein